MDSNQKEDGSPSERDSEMLIIPKADQLDYEKLAVQVRRLGKIHGIKR